MIFSNFPRSSFVTPGILLGVGLVFTGMSLTALGAFGRRAVAA